MNHLGRKKPPLSRGHSVSCHGQTAYIIVSMLLETLRDGYVARVLLEMGCSANAKPISAEGN
jgi:hypothetical protein